jgi:hypothetical protein
MNHPSNLVLVCWRKLEKILDVSNLSQKKTSFPIIWQEAFSHLTFDNFKLAVVQIGVKAIGRQQGFMAALFNDIAFVHHQDQVGIADGGKAVGDDETGAVLHQVFHGFLDQYLGTRVDRADGSIQEQDIRVHQDGAGDGHELFLPLGDIAGFLIQGYVVAIR